MKNFYLKGATCLVLAGMILIFSACDDGGGNDTSNVPVTGVTLNVLNTSVYIDETEQLMATISPTDATNQNLTWTSEDE